MSVYTSPVFVALFLSSPIWLLITGTIIRTKLGGEHTRIGRLGIAFQFLCQIATLLNIILAVVGPSVWPTFFNSIYAIGWIFILVSCVLGVAFGKHTFSFMTDTNAETFGVGSYWGIAALLLTIAGLVYGVYWVSSTLITYFVELYNSIAING